MRPGPLPGARICNSRHPAPLSQSPTGLAADLSDRRGPRRVADLTRDADAGAEREPDRRCTAIRARGAKANRRYSERLAPSQASTSARRIFSDKLRGSAAKSMNTKALGHL